MRGAGGQRVHGELFEIDAAQADALLDALDRYEGASFRRECATVQGPAGAVEAWLYLFVGDASQGRVVTGGDYLAPDCSYYGTVVPEGPRRPRKAGYLPPYGSALLA